MSIQTYSSTIRRKEMDAVLSCMVDEKVGPGELNARLVQVARDFFSVSGAVALRSPSLALKYALKCMNLPEQAPVMVSALAPDWQYAALVDLGYTPVVLDVNPETALVSETEIVGGQKRGATVLVLHETAGFLPDFEALRSTGVILIEDVSQSAGAVFGERKAGSFGTFSILGLEENDILTAGGGAVLMAGAPRDWAALKALSETIPATDRLPDINSALGMVQLKEFPKNDQVRKEMKEMYVHSLLQTRHKTIVQLGEYALPAVYSFPVLLESGVKDVLEYAERKEIEVLPAFAGCVYDRRKDDEEGAPRVEHCKNAASLLLRCVNFPLYPMLGSANAAKIAKVLGTLP